MSFQAYLDNIEKQTGVTPDGFIRLATQKGFTAPGTKATPITDWLKTDTALATAMPSRSSNCCANEAD